MTTVTVGDRPGQWEDPPPHTVAPLRNSLPPTRMIGWFCTGLSRWLVFHWALSSVIHASLGHQHGRFLSSVFACVNQRGCQPRYLAGAGQIDRFDLGCGLFPVQYTKYNLAFTSAPALPNAANTAFLSLVYSGERTETPEKGVRQILVRIKLVQMAVCAAASSTDGL